MQLKRFNPSKVTVKPIAEGHAADELQQKLVIYVEDNPDNWNVAQLALRRRFRLAWAKNAIEACALVTQHQTEVSAILMDIELQGSALDGIELTKLFRGKLPRETLPEYAKSAPVLQTPILFVTAFSGRYSQPELMAAGGNQLIAKPVNFAELSLALGGLHADKAQTPAMEIVLGLLHDRSTDAHRVAELVNADPKLAARLTQLAAICVPDGRTPTTIESVYEALGPEGIAYLGVCVAVAQLIPREAAVGELTSLTLRRGAAAQVIAASGRYLPATPQNRARAMAVGMLLDSGLAVRSSHDPRGSAELARAPATSRAIRELAAGEVDHPTRGARLAAEWKLPEDIVIAVRKHHAAAVPEDALARIGFLAEQLAAVFEPGDIELMHAEALRVATAAGLEEAQLNAFLEAVPGVTTSLCAALGLGVAHERSLRDLRADGVSSCRRVNRTYEDLVRTLESLVSEKESLLSRLREANVRITAAFEKDMALIGAVQALFLPKQVSYTAGNLSLCGFYRAATKCGGDWWWYDATRQDRVTVLVGDVTGHGAGAAMVTAAIASTHRLLWKLGQSDDVPAMLTCLNSELFDMAKGDYAMTMSAVSVDATTGLVKWWNVGAPPLLKLDAAGKGRPISCPGTLLGLAADGLQIGYREFQLDPGERLLVFTDGLVELPVPAGAHPFGLKSMVRMIDKIGNVPVEQAAKTIVASVDQVLQELPQEDDLTFALIARRPAES